MAVTAGKIFIPGGRLVDPLLRAICQPGLGAHDEEDEEDRPAHLLPHLWRRLELSAPAMVAAAERSHALRRGFAPRAPRRYAGHYVAPFQATDFNMINTCH